MKRIVRQSKRFKRDYKRLLRSGGKNMDILHHVMRLLIGGGQLSARYRDHQLLGEWGGYRDCHIEGDLVLIYALRTDGKRRDIIIFHAIGNHEHLFG